MALIGSISEYKEGKEDFESYLERLEQLKRMPKNFWKVYSCQISQVQSYEQLTKALSDH